MKRGIAFSGGKDSWACLWLNEEYLEDLPVFWVNTGKAYPETIEMIEKARKMCGNFIEIKTDQQAQNDSYGLPSDIVPINYTKIGQDATGKKYSLIQSYIDCCYSNISGPLNDAARLHGVTHLVRGQRSDENHKTPARSGHFLQGIVYEQPLDDWKEADVLEYLSTKMEIPEHFKIKHSSLDCYDCTAFCAQSADRIEWMKSAHPEKYSAYEARRSLVATAIHDAMSEASYGIS